MVQQCPIFAGKATVHKVKCEEMASMFKLCNAPETLKRPLYSSKFRIDRLVYTREDPMTR